MINFIQFYTEISIVTSPSRTQAVYSLRGSLLVRSATEIVNRLFAVPPVTGNICCQGGTLKLDKIFKTYINAIAVESECGAWIITFSFVVNTFSNASSEEHLIETQFKNINLRFILS